MILSQRAFPARGMCAAIGCAPPRHGVVSWTGRGARYPAPSAHDWRGNLVGNTLDALHERFEGRSAAYRRLLDEPGVVVTASPFLAFVNGFAAWHRHRRKDV